jgi:mannitol-1-phosphate 5-dehydrogenase
VQVLGGTRESITPAGVFALDDAGWRIHLAAADLAFTAVVGTNLPQLGAALAPALAGRGTPLSIITCENDTGAAATLRSAAGPAPAAVRFGEAMVLTTCLAPAAGDPPLLVRTQDLLRLPCDREVFAGDPPALPGLEPLPRFATQLRRKVWTYNAINAVISYLGALRGHALLAEASADPAIAPLARQAAEECDRALCAEFGFDPVEQATWSVGALAKFADPLIPDPIARNAGDPERKLRRDDRLVGPALLTLAHGLRPRALATGIRAAARYQDPGKPSPLTRCGSLAAVLEQVCGLPAGHPLHQLVLDTPDA